VVQIWEFKQCTGFLADVDDDFDIAFFSEDNTATACTSYPFSLGVNSFSIGLWVRFSERRGEGTFLTLFGSE